MNKKGIRVLGVAESFRKGQTHSVLAGAVMRGDLVVDGIVYGSSTVGGDDATASIAHMYRRLGRNDINLVMLAGCILSMYNIVDVDGLSKMVGLPLVCLTYKETSGIESAIASHFPGHETKKLEAYRRLGPREKIRLPSGYSLFARRSGIGPADLRSVLGMFTLQGAVPEPVRLAKLIARAGATLSSRRGSSGPSGRKAP